MQARIALVTGASRGIGRAIAKRLAADGYRVVGTATTEAGAEAISGRLGASGCGRQLDVADPDSVTACFRALAETPGPPAVLVNNAGVTRDNLLLRMSPEQWESVLATNLGGIYRVARAALRGMLRARWGRIVNVSSVVARLGNPGQTNYAASKAAVEGFTRSLALEVAGRGVTVNAVAPGYISSEMTEALSEAQRAGILARIPVGRTGTGEEVAATVAFLASDEAAYISGETIQVNGGLYMG